MKKSAEEKKIKERNIVLLMVQLYCKKKHAENTFEKSDNLCLECKELLEYVFQRIDKCPFTETKTFCSVCKIHCYKQEMRKKIKNVMKFSGPRMLLRHPFIALNHMIETIKSKMGAKK